MFEVQSRPPLSVVFAVTALLSATGLILYAGYLREFHGGDPWVTADWLISYAGGFIRRGFFGELLRSASHSGLPVRWVLFAVQCLIQVTVALIIARIYLARAREPQWMLILLCPAFVLFPFYEFAGNPVTGFSASFRKEELGFFAFGALLVAGAFGTTPRFMIGLAACLYAIACLSHEVNAFACSFFLWMLYRLWSAGSITRSVFFAASALFITIAAASVISASLTRASPEQLHLICRAVIEMGFAPRICEGAITWLEKDTGYSLAYLRWNLPSMIEPYVVALILSLLPLALTDWSRRNRGWLLLGAASLLPLFVVAIDWGRWIRIYVFYVYSILLVASLKGEAELRPVPIIAIIVYLIPWSIPHVIHAAGRQGLGIGLLGLLLP